MIFIKIDLFLYIPGDKVTAYGGTCWIATIVAICQAYTLLITLQVQEER
jgi:hypothetical protein